MPLLEMENSIQFILQLTEIGLWKSELLILEQDMKMRKSFTEKKILVFLRKSFTEKKILVFLRKSFTEKKILVFWENPLRERKFSFFWENPFPERFFSFSGAAGFFSLLADFFMSIYLKIIRGSKEGKQGGKKWPTGGKNVKFDVNDMTPLGQ